MTSSKGDWEPKVHPGEQSIQFKKENGLIYMRDSKEPDGSNFVLNEDEFDRFLMEAKCGNFDDLL